MSEKTRQPTEIRVVHGFLRGRSSDMVVSQKSIDEIQSFVRNVLLILYIRLEVP